MADLLLVPRRVPSGVTLETFRVRGEQASLGRGAHCDWILPDPQRLLSKRHCELTARGGQWLITDLSSNGTTVRGETLPPGVPQELRAGDAIGCGSYLIDVVLESTDSDEATQSFPAADLSPFADPPTPASRPYASSPAMSAPLSNDDDGEPASPSGPVFDMGRQQRYGRSPVETLSIIHPFSFALSENDTDFGLPGPTVSGNVSRPGAEATPLSGLHDAFQPPRPAAALLPEDWDSPLTRTDLPEVGGTASPFDAPPGASPVETDTSDVAGLDGPAQGAPNPFSAAGETHVRPPIARGAGSPHHPDRGADRGSDAPPPATEPSLSASPFSAETPDEPSRPATQARRPVRADAAREGAQDPGAIAAFLRGAGIEGAPEESAEAYFEELGRTFRALVVGLRRAMIARARVKGEFRIEQTMIQPFGNNPLKFAVDDDDALSALLGVGRRTGVSGPQAVADALRDIRVHEMAVTRALEPAMREFLAANGPKAVLDQLAFPEDQHLSLLRRAKAWSTYVRLHDDLAASLTETLDGAFGRAFGRAYEAARAELEEADSPRNTARPGSETRR